MHASFALCALFLVCRVYALHLHGLHPSSIASYPLLTPTSTASSAVAATTPCHGSLRTTHSNATHFRLAAYACDHVSSKAKDSKAVAEGKRGSYPHCASVEQYKPVLKPVSVDANDAKDTAVAVAAARNLFDVVWYELVRPRHLDLVLTVHFWLPLSSCPVLV